MFQWPGRPIWAFSNSEMYILKSMNDYLAARSMVDKQKALFNELLEYIDKMADEHPSSKLSCSSLSQDMIIVCGNLINSVYFNVGDTEAMDDWKIKLRNHLDSKGGAATIGEGLDDMNLTKYLFRDRDSGETPLSILPRLPRLLVGDTHSHEESFSAYWQRGQDLVEKYFKANSYWSDDLNKLDVDGAEVHLRTYIHEAAPNNIISHPENFLPIFVAAQLGEFETASKILRGMLNPNLLDSDLNQTPAIKWRQPQTSEQKLQESIGLGNVLAACALAQDWTLGHRVLEGSKNSFPNILTPGQRSHQESFGRFLAGLALFTSTTTSL
jgi:hypothetical protein